MDTGLGTWQVSSATSTDPEKIEFPCLEKLQAKEGYCKNVKENHQNSKLFILTTS